MMKKKSKKLLLWLFVLTFVLTGIAGCGTKQKDDQEAASTETAGAILGNLFQIFEVNLPGRMIFLAIYGLFGGIFVGCWAMALAEILNVFPIFMRRARIVRYLAVFVVMVALGKGIGAGLFFWKRW